MRVHMCMHMYTYIYTVQISLPLSISAFVSARLHESRLACRFVRDTSTYVAVSKPICLCGKDLHAQVKMQY